MKLIRKIFFEGNGIVMMLIGGITVLGILSIAFGLATLTEFQ
jgi:hypothetical protein